MRPKHWKHDRQHFYKYVSATTAKLILSNSTLQWSAASCFNDPFDSQFDLTIDYDEEALVERVVNNNWEVISGVREMVPGNKLGAIIVALAKRKLNIPEDEFKRGQREATRESLRNGDLYLPLVQNTMRLQLRDFKFLCLSETFENMLMWSHYSKHHTGAVLRLTCIAERDSVWGAAEQVRYTDRMPVLLDQENFIRFLSGEISLSTEATLEKVIFAKALEWAYEKEWRVPRPGTDPNSEVLYAPFHESELTGIYLGCRIAPNDRDELIALTKRKYAHAEVFAGNKSASRFAVEFERI